MNEAAPQVDLKSRDSFKFWTPVSVRWSDQDAMGHINNVAVAAYVEAGRVPLIHTFWDKTKYPDLAFILARVTIDYVREFRYPGSVDVGGRVLRVGTKSFTTGYGVFFKDACVATSESVNVFFDTAKRAAVTPPEEIKQKLVAALEMHKS